MTDEAIYELWVSRLAEWHDKPLEFAKAVAAEQRKESAALCSMKNAQIMLQAGEMTAEELRSVRAVLNLMADRILRG